MRVTIKIELEQKWDLKDPQSTLLGRKIISDSIKLLDESGLEAFTFKKLSLVINSTEASIYRYFPNKYELVCYLTSLYWEWMAYQIRFFHSNNVADPVQRIKIIIGLLSKTYQASEANSYIQNTLPDATALSRVVAKESSVIRNKLNHCKLHDLRIIKSCAGKQRNLLKKSILIISSHLIWQLLCLHSRICPCQLWMISALHPKRILLLKAR